MTGLDDDRPRAGAGTEPREGIDGCRSTSRGCPNPRGRDLEEAIRRYASIWTVYGRAAAVGVESDYADDRDLWRRWADSEFTFWNCAFVAPQASTPDQLARSLRAAGTFLACQRRAGMVCAARARLNLLSKAEIEAAGLEETTTMVEMSANVSSMRLRPSEGLRYRRVTDMTLVNEYADVNADAYAIPRRSGRAGMAVAPAAMMREAFSYVAYEENRPVAAASILAHEGRLYLGLVATVPDRRMRGYASQTISHALEAARGATGLDHAGLHATVAGAPVYEKLGYRRRFDFALLSTVPQRRSG